MARLKSALETNGVLVGGKVVDTIPSLSAKDKDKILSSIYILRDANYLNSLRGWFGDKVKLSTDNDYALANEMSSALLGEISENVVRNFRFYASVPLDRKWPAKTRFIGPLNVTGTNARTELPSGNSVVFSNKDMQFTLDGKTETISFKNIIIALNAKNLVDSYSTPPRVVTVGDRLKMVVKEASGNVDDDGLVTSIEFWLVVQE